MKYSQLFLQKVAEIIWFVSQYELDMARTPDLHLVIFPEPHKCLTSRRSPVVEVETDEGWAPQLVVLTLQTSHAE